MLLGGTSPAWADSWTYNYVDEAEDDRGTGTYTFRHENECMWYWNDSGHKTYLKTQGKTEETRKTAIYGKVKDIIAFIGEDKKQHALFEEQINRDLDDIVAHLKADLGNVSDEDSRFICYTIAGFDTNIVATLLNLSVSNVYTKRSRLRERIRKLDSPHKEQYLRVI